MLNIDTKLAADLMAFLDEDDSGEEFKDRVGGNPKGLGFKGFREGLGFGVFGLNVFLGA